MSIAAEKISPNTIRDMLDLFDAQPWIADRHEEITELWNICEKREEQILIKSLITDFCMFDAKMEAAACKKIDEKINAWGLSPGTTWIVAVANDNEVDGSTAGLQKLKNKITPNEDWHARFLGNIPAASVRVKDTHSIVLFDDFIGTGHKLKKKKDWIAALLAKVGVTNVSYYFAAFSGMQFGIDYLRAATGCDVFAHVSLKRGISERYNAAEAAHMIDVMLEIESRLGANYKHKKIADYSLGYMKSEALYCGPNDNCPNNVFPILWWPYKKNGAALKTLLQRVG